MTSVADLMSSPVVSCSGDTTLGELATLLAERRIHGVVVLDETGGAAGVVADTDVLAGEWLATDADSLATMRSMTAAELMTSPPVTIEADATIGAAAAQLHTARLSRLVVVRGGKPVGVLTTSDLIRELGRGHLGRGTVADVMSHGLVACRNTATVRQAARVMTDRHVRALVVVAPDGRPLGVVTGTDLLPLVGADAGDGPIAGPDASADHDRARRKPARGRRPGCSSTRSTGSSSSIPTRRTAFPLGIVATTDIVAEMAEPGSVWR